MNKSATKRKHLSNKTRFEVFKRDGFTCQYCGAKPPQAVLHADHVTPVALGGLDCEDNLITSCSACNLGKGAGPLTDVPQSVEQKMQIAVERKEQLDEFNKFLAAESRKTIRNAKRVAAVLEIGTSVRDIDVNKMTSIKTFLARMPVTKVIEAAEIANTRKFAGTNDNFRYFCGVCWGMIKEAA